MFFKSIFLNTKTNIFITKKKQIKLLKRQNILKGNIKIFSKAYIFLS